MTVLSKVHSLPTIEAAMPAHRGWAIARACLEFFAGAGAFILAAVAADLFMMNTIADRLETLIEQQNAASLKLSANLQYYELHPLNDTSMPPGLFSDLVEFSRNTATMMYECVGFSRSRKPARSAKRNFVLISRLPDESWSAVMLKELKAKDGSSLQFDHTGVNPNTDGRGIVTEGQYQIRLYQSLRDFWQENCTSYKDARSGISTYLLPLLYALLGAALCDLRCRFGTSDGNTRQLTSLGGARYATAIIAGAIVGVFTSLFPTSLSLPPLLIAFLLGYSVDIFTNWLDTLIRNLSAGRGKT